MVKPKEKEMMNGYLFDLDGTLIQSMHVWEDAVMRLFDRLNLKMDIDEARDAFSAMKFTEVLEALIQHFQLQSFHHDLILRDRQLIHLLK